LAAAQSQSTQLPDGEGKEILESACTVCHSLKEVTKFKGFYSRENWRDIIQTMIADGAVLKESEVPVLLDYLTTTFPKDFPDGEGKKLLETSCSGCHAATDVRKFDGSYAKSDWNMLVRSMVALGAPLTEEQVPALVDYLADTFPVLKTPISTSR
jgi:cytochrome c5